MRKLFFALSFFGILISQTSTYASTINVNILQDEVDQQEAVMEEIQLLKNHLLL